LVRRPLNTAVVQGSSVTLHCSSDDSSAILLWYNSLCLTNKNVAQCTGDLVYSGYSVQHSPSRFRVFNESEGVDATQVTRDLNINPTQLNDAGVFLCAERRFAVASVQTSSAQLIVLGNFMGIFY